MSTTTSQVFKGRLEAAEVYFGASACRSWQFAADVGGATHGETLDLNIINEEGVEVLGYVYMSDGATVDPAPAGKTLVAEIVYADGSDGPTRAAALVTALDGLATPILGYYKLQATGSDTVLIDNAYPGAITAEAQGGASAVTEAELRAGFGGLLGPTKSALGVATETTLFNITSNQTGELILDQVIQGTNITVSADFLDFSQTNKEILIGNGVGNIIDDGGTNIVGIGESKLFQNVSDIGGRLILHPIRLNRTDRSADLVVWNTLAQLEEIPYDGTDTQAVSVTFTANLDQGKDDRVNLGVFGSEWISNVILD